MFHKIDKVQTDRDLVLWMQDAQQLEANLIHKGYKPLLARQAWEVCKKVIFVLYPEMAVTTKTNAKLEVLPRCILVRNPHVPDHNKSVVNTASPDYKQDISWANPHAPNTANLTYLWVKKSVLEILWAPYRSGKREERDILPNYWVAYYK